ncbi:MAG: methionyl-tRNA formyltransferase [Bacteroidetes bacterium]|nr:methionyl-tRNA formyltransferase [Bacteroidota bacterium]
MGTPAFAVASLKALLDRGFPIVAVVTSPDKPAGRGMHMQKSDVKIFAEAHHLRILQPVNLKAPEFVNTLKEINASLQVVVAFRMLPEVIWNMPPLGTINVHASLLPQYRGAAPIHHAIINGEKETGVTIFKLQHAIDTGNILASLKMPIGVQETTGELYDKLQHAGAHLLAETVCKMINKELVEKAQETNALSLKTAPKIFKKDTLISWNKSVDEVYNFIRGLSPYPAAQTFLDGKTLKIFSASKENAMPNGSPGDFLTDGKTFLKFTCNDGFIHATDLQLEGKKRMSIEVFLKGYHFK